MSEGWGCNLEYQRRVISFRIQDHLGFKKTYTHETHAGLHKGRLTFSNINQIK